MQKVALRVQLRDARDALAVAEGRLVAARAQRAEAWKRLELARAGLLVALPHLADERVRCLVGVALEQTAL